MEDVAASWDAKASAWDECSGDQGDQNRQLHSDPVLWAFVKAAVSPTRVGEPCALSASPADVQLEGRDLETMRVLDAGCGNGYLTRLLGDCGFGEVVGLDLSGEMIRHAESRSARKKQDNVTFRTGSFSDLENDPTVEPESFDLIVSNFTIMDTPDLPGVCRSFQYALRKGGHCVIVLCHPFNFMSRTELSVPPEIAEDQRYAVLGVEENAAERGESPWQATGSLPWNPFPDNLVFRPEFPYYASCRVTEQWGKDRFSSPFIHYHRPVRDYWRAFRRHGFRVVEMDEPIIVP
mmetsp:Transcript_13159/g.31085  ORF Transcript_13159/g.31085 Transcript_13159/m.31085 type:complete len:292 (+) Transcript_13159:8-883(+)